MRDDVDEAPVPAKKSGLTVFGAGTAKPTTGKRKLVETELETEVHSEAATGNLNGDEAAISSDLSPIEEVVETTPRPKKKPRTGDEDAVPANTAVNHARRTGATGTNNVKTHANKNKPPVKEPSVKAIRPNNDDIAAFMKIPPDTVSPRSSVFINNNPLFRRTFLVDSSSKASTSSDSSKAPSVTSIRTSTSGSSSRSPAMSSLATGSSSEAPTAPRVNCTKAVPPTPVTKPPKPSQTQPFKIDTTKMAKSRKKVQPKIREEGIVGSGAEEAERSAALFSPPKKGARVTSEHLVKFKESNLQINVQEPTPRKSDGKKGRKKPAPSVRASEADERDESSEGSDNESVMSSAQALQVPHPDRDLPGYPESEKIWKKHFVPTLLLFQGAQPEPWNWTDTTSVSVVQKIWDAVFGDDLPHKVIFNECVHYLASQKLWDWRSSLRQAAEVVVGHYLDATRFTQDVEGRGEFCTSIVENGRFLYENLLADKTTRLFRSPFMLTVLAVHLDATKNALNVPDIYPEGTGLHLPIRAIALSAAALERIFTLYASRLMKREVNSKKKVVWRPIPQFNPNTGKHSASYSDFSEVHFQGPTSEYIERLEKMAHSRITAIVESAEEYTGKRSVSGDLATRTEVEVRGRNELADDDDDE